MTFPEQLTLSLLAAVAASVLTLLGNWLIQSAQARRVVRAELREFVRAQHADTVSTVADLDLFMRNLSAAVIAGMTEHRAGGHTAAENVELFWEGDLLRRLRLLKFGHPDPDVRQAAEVMEDEMWPYIVTATSRKDREMFDAPSSEERRRVSDNAQFAMQQLRSAVWRAPRRDVPHADYDGSVPPSRLWRAMNGQDAPEKPTK